MKQLRILFATICCLFFAPFYSQTYKSPDDVRIINACINYIKIRHLNNGESVDDYTSSMYKLNDKRYVVVLSFTTSHQEKTKMYSDNGFFDPVRGWSNTATLVKNVENRREYALFVNSQGEPINSIGGLNKNILVKTLNNNTVLLFYYYYEKRNQNVTRFYKEIMCYNPDGTKLWSIDPQMFFQDYAITENNLYIVGSNDRSQYKVLSLKDGSVVTEKVFYEPKYSGSRFRSISLTIDGVVLIREYIGGSTITETYSYVSNDNSYRDGLVFKLYDTNKAIDQVTIGTRYLNGDGFTRDYKKAVEWYDKAANQNNSRGQYCLGYCYQNGLGVTQDLAKAASLYEKSTSQGDKDAMAALSKMYLNGNGVSKDLSKALHWQEILAFDGDKEARKTVMRNQSAQYEKADISASEVRSKALDSHKQKEYEWAEFCMKRAIELGDGDARLDYGLWLANGDGVQKDYSKAEEYLTPFAESGLKEASSVLGMIYRNLNDKKKEMYWVEKAAIDGDVESQIKMAEAYQDGIGVKKDKKAAAAMYERAANQGNVGALIKMVYAYSYGNGVKKNYNTADKYFRMLPHQIAFEIANSIFWGHDVKKNKELGLAFFLHAGQMGNKEAMKEYEFWRKDMKMSIGW